MKTIISNHNRQVLTEDKPTINAKCNCRNKEKCPVPEECCQPNVVYHATVKHHNDNRQAEYIGSTEPQFKLRFNNHTKSFKHNTYKNDTTLSKYVWDNNLNPTPNIKWKYMKKCSTYRVGNKVCDLCLSEKNFYNQKPSFCQPNKQKN